MRGFGKRADVMQIVFNPGTAEKLRIGKLNAAGFPKRRGSLSAGELSTFRIYGNDARNFFLQFTDDGRAVGLIFNEHGVGLGILGMASLDCCHGRAEIEPVISAVRQHEIFSAGSAPDLPGNKVIFAAAAERAIPGLNHEFKLLWKLAIEAHPLTLDDAAIERSRSMLVLSVEGPATHADALAIEKRLRQTRGPEEIARFASSEMRAVGQMPRLLIIYRNCRKADMLPAAAFTG